MGQPSSPCTRRLLLQLTSSFVRLAMACTVACGVERSAQGLTPARCVITPQPLLLELSVPLPLVAAWRHRTAACDARLLLFRT